jgi:hypothetical protein
LRLALGPALAERLMAADLGQVSQMVITSIRHEPDLPPATLSRLEAQAALLQGQRAQAVEQLQLAGPADASALRLQLQLARDMNETPSPTLLDTAEAIAATLRHDELGGEILFLVGELRAMSGDHAGALAVIARGELWSRDRPSLQTDIARAEAAIWAAIAQTPSDAAFLETALSHDEWRRADMPFSVTAAVASRLNRFGLGQRRMFNCPNLRNLFCPNQTGKRCLW